MHRCFSSWIDVTAIRGSLAAARKLPNVMMKAEYSLCERAMAANITQVLGVNMAQPPLGSLDHRHAILFHEHRGSKGATATIGIGNRTGLASHGRASCCTSNRSDSSPSLIPSPLRGPGFEEKALGTFSVHISTREVSPFRRLYPSKVTSVFFDGRSGT